jgi:hypothetical protein
MDKLFFSSRCGDVPRITGVGAEIFERSQQPDSSTRNAIAHERHDTLDL